MAHRVGQDRSIPIRLNLEEVIEKENPVRVIDAYVDQLDLQLLGFNHVVPAEMGSPPYHPGDLLKLYIYGYENRIRSSRQLARACEVNIELWWLLKGIKPSYRTIARFRSEHSAGMRQLFERYVQDLKKWDLLGKELQAVDSVKLRAQNSKKNNYNKKKIERHRKRIVEKIRNYMKALDESEAVDEPEPGKEELLGHIQTQMVRLGTYQELEEQLVESGEKQLSTTDADARALILHRDIVEVCYAAQVVADERHKLLIHYETTNENDAHALHRVARGGQTALGVQQIDTLADKGYHTGSELAACATDQIRTYVAPPQPSSSKPTPGYRMVDFEYVEQGDYYRCPEGQILQTNGRYYSKGTADYQVKHYKTKACTDCPARSLCTQNKLGRLIERSQYQGAIDANRKRVEANKTYYRKRQAIIEHPFGTIKRAWGYTYTLLKGKQKVDGELGLIFFCYNLRRSVSILGVPLLLEHLTKQLLSILWPATPRCIRLSKSALK